PKEMVENTAGNGYNTEYYFLTVTYDSLWDWYVENPKITSDELVQRFAERNFDPVGRIGIPIRFYLSDPESEPSEELVKKVADEIKQTDGIPGGDYFILLNDVYIDPKDGIGEKDNTKRQGFVKSGETK